MSREVLFSPVGKPNEVRKTRGFACRHFMCPSDHCKSRIRDTAIIFGKPFTNGAIMSGVIWLLGGMSRKHPVTPHSLSERGHIWHVRVPWDGKQGPYRGFPIRPTVEGFFNFGVPKRFFFCEAATGCAFEYRARPPRSGRRPPMHHLSHAICAR